MKGKREVLQHFDELVVRHAIFLELRDELLAAIQDGARGRVIMIVGPTGVGKTWLSLDVIEILIDYVEKNPELGYGRPLFLEAESPEYGEFSWRSFYVQGLRKLGEPAIRSKRNIDRLIEELRLGKPIPTYQPLKVHELRTLYLQALEELRPIAVFVDEVASMGKSHSHENRGGNLNVLKSFSNQRTTIHVLLGTIDAKKMLYHEAQTARRVEPVPFWHYSRVNPDVSYFVKIMKETLEEVGVVAEHSLFQDEQFIYAHSLGLAGVGIDWLRRSTERMFRARSKVLKKEHLQTTRLSNLQLSAMARDMKVFEREYSETKDFDVHKFFDEAGTNATSKSAPVTVAARRPGQRNPTRDPVSSPVELEKP